MKRVFGIRYLLIVAVLALVLPIEHTGAGDQDKFTKQSMPDFGAHSENWCWAATAANIFWWFEHGPDGVAGTADDPSPGIVPAAFRDIDPQSQGLGPIGVTDPYFDTNDAGPVPVQGYRRLLREIAQATFKDFNMNGVQDPGEPAYIYGEAVQKWDYLVGLRDYIAARGVPLVVHEKTDPAGVVPRGCVELGRSPNPGPDGIPDTADDVTVPGVITEFEAPTLRHYERFQDAILLILFAGPDGVIGTSDDFSHVVTGVGDDSTLSPATITVSDSSTHAAPPHDDIGGPGVDHNNAPEHDPSPYDVCTVIAIGPPWQINCPAHGLGQVISLISISRQADVSITMTDSPDPVNVDRNLTYTLRINNRGPFTATDVEVTDTLPSNVNFVRADGCSRGGRTITCRLGNLAIGQIVTRSITVRPTAPGKINNTARVTANQPDPRPGNNKQTIETRVNP